MDRIAWGGQADLDGAAERSFRLHRNEGVVPGVLWWSGTAGRRPVVLLGHGGSGHKRSARLVRMGRRLAAAGLAAVAIDGPRHGDRVPGPLPSEVYQQQIADEGIEHVTARMTRDWLRTVAALAGEGIADETNVSVFGLSMGARYGLPVAAALGPRLRCAVFAKFGLRESGLHPGLRCPELTSAAARAVSAPVLWHVQADDEIFPRDGQHELFALLGSGDKRLVERPGPHNGSSPEDEESWLNFIRAHANPRFLLLSATGCRRGSGPDRMIPCA